MNILFAVVFLAAAAVFLVSDPNGFLTAMLTGGQRAATLCLSLAAVYCVWLGFFKVLERKYHNNSSHTIYGTKWPI